LRSRPGPGQSERVNQDLPTVELRLLLAINESRVLRSTKVAVAGWGSSCVG